MTVQDDERERELCRLFNLMWDPAHQRGGTDAYFNVEVAGQRYQVPVEVKSTTGDTIATARDVGMQHIQKWKQVMWVIGFYTRDRRPELIRSMCLTPADLLPWISRIEQKILPDFELARRASQRLTTADLFAICGQQDAYSIEDARRLHKNQWTVEQYTAAQDIVVDGRPMISPDAMLRILKLRARYIAERGATLNNPHIDKTFLNTFEGTNRVITEEQAIRIREITTAYIANDANHPFPEAVAPAAPEEVAP